MKDIDFEQELYKHFGQVKDFTLGMRIGQYFYELGCRRTAEKYDEIEYNRQREETAYDTRQYTPRPSVDIEDVARVQFASHAKVFDKKRKAVFDWEQFKEVAGIFYGFGKKDLEPEKPVPNDLQEYASSAGFDYVDDIEVEHPGHRWNDHDVEYAYRDGIVAGAEWQKVQMMDEWLKDRDGCFWDGVNEGKKAMEDAILTLIESRLSEIIGDAQPKPALRAELQELIKRIEQ